MIFSANIRESGCSINIDLVTPSSTTVIGSIYPANSNIDDIMNIPIAAEVFRDKVIIPLNEPAFAYL